MKNSFITFLIIINIVFISFISYQFFTQQSQEAIIVKLQNQINKNTNISSFQNKNSNKNPIPASIDEKTHNKKSLFYDLIGTVQSIRLNELIVTIMVPDYKNIQENTLSPGDSVPFLEKKYRIAINKKTIWQQGTYSTLNNGDTVKIRTNSDIKNTSVIIATEITVLKIPDIPKNLKHE